MTQTSRTALILGVSISLAVIVTWFAPSLSAGSLNLLFRLRGALNAPADVVIVAIDDESLRRIGQWPWPRSVMANALDKITHGRPRVVGLDVVYAEPSDPAEDRRLAEAIARNGRVVLPAQLYEAVSTRAATELAQPAVAWLRPLGEFAASARAVGHAHVSPSVDGMARAIQLSKADDRADTLWAFGLEVVRVAGRISNGDQEQQSGLLLFGPYHIPVMDEAAGSKVPGVSIVRQNETLINYAGPAGSFPYHSISDLIESKMPHSAFTDKIVLVGAAAQSLGDTRIVPFTHYSAGHRQGGQEMPGIEIHANIINTIRGNLSLRSFPEWMAFAAALAVILCATLAIRWFDGWRQMIILGLILLAIVVGSFIAFSSYLLVPPLIPMLTGFAVVIPLLLNRSLTASRELDLRLAALVGSQEGFLTPGSVGQDAILSHNFLPRSLAWKLRAVDDLTMRLLARMSFINRILSSMGEGVLVADLSGRIVFANREAVELFGCGEDEIIGAYFDEFLIEHSRLDPLHLREAVTGAVDGGVAQLECEIPSVDPHYYSLLLSALNADGGTRWHFVPRAIGVVALISDITRRVELDRMKTETLQLVSHELRTPLTSIQGLSDVLLKFPVAADESREMLRTIHAEALRLGETINRYLDLTRLESSAQPLHLTAVPCGELIVSCIRDVSVFAAERGIRLYADICPSVPALQADAQLLTQALNNLLSNAIKYSPPETEVVVTAELNHAGVTISVQDQGFGIPEDACERIFEKFYRLERDTTSNVVGTGLGLPLVKEIVELHCGRITFESDAATGSTFTIHLPLQTQALPVTPG